MIILRQRHFSIVNRKMIDEIIQKLERDGYDDFDTSTSITRENISISVEGSGMVKIYLPADYEYSQYNIDDFIRRKLGPHYRTSTSLDRNIYIQKVGQALGVEQIAKIVEYIIDTEEFCTLIN